MRFHQEWIDKIMCSVNGEAGECFADFGGKCKKCESSMDKIEIILRDFRESAIRVGRQAGMADARARRTGGGPRKRR